MEEKDKVYKYLNPVGIQEPVEQHPLAPRLDRLEGKNITMSVGAGGEQGILIPLVKKLPEKYPQVNWNIKTQLAGHGFTSAAHIDEYY